MRGGTKAASGRHRERPSPAAIHLVGKIDNPKPVFGGRRYDRGAGPIAKQYAGRTILIVDDRRHHVGSDDERMIMRAGGHELGRRGQGIGKPGAGRPEVEAPGVVGTDLRLHETGSAWEEHVRGHGRHHDEPDVGRGQAGLFDGRQRRLLPKVGRRRPLVDDVALSDSGALDDPFV